MKKTEILIGVGITEHNKKNELYNTGESSQSVS